MDDPHLKLFRNKLGSTDKEVGVVLMVLFVLLEFYPMILGFLKWDWQSRQSIFSVCK
jgi:hypothetical protein